MITPADRVWERIRETARSLAAQKSQPSMRHAQAIVAHIIREEAVQLPPPFTLDALAQELLRGISEAA